MFKLIPLLLVFTSSVAFADHGIFNATASSASANTVVQLEQQLGRFETQETQGRYSMSYLQVEFALLEQLSIMAGVPWVTLSPAGAQSAAGLGDSTTGVKYQLTPSGDHGFGTSLGLNVELPTGDVSERIGGGHYGFEGVFAVSKPVSSELQIISRLSHSFSPDHSHGASDDHSHGASDDHSHGASDDQGEIGSLIRPHGEQESTALISLVYATELQFIETAVRGGVAFDHDESYISPIDLIIRAGFNVGKRTTVVTSLSQTIAGEMRTPWTLSLGLTINYDRHAHRHDERHHDHDDHDHDHPHAHH